MTDNTLKKGLKGRIAEAIVESMFEEMGWLVYKFGAEFTARSVIDKHKKLTGGARKYISKLPDFIIKKGDRVEFVEVKFRSKGTRGLSEYSTEWKDYPYPDSLLIIVSPKGILGGKATEENVKHWRFDLLPNIEGLDFDHDIAVKYVNIASKLFGDSSR